MIHSKKNYDQFRKKDVTLRKRRYTSVESDFAASLNGLLILGQSSARTPHNDDGPSKFNER